ncbi:helix-turn-helix domain-containing protein [Nafulsella turpanensis]|uniref:helix-turn-helix domain-containing protein n=1 Tax=Nafulsella turpanensis TaxID=1265690 RepID=UPI0012680034|nr:AraC family transcriptional regulator [Nafulsella turpanensis]
MSKGEENDSLIPLRVNKVLASYYQSVLSYFQESVTPAECLLQMKFEELIINSVYFHQNSPLSHYFKQLCTEARISLSSTLQTNFSYHLPLEEFAWLSGRSLSTFERDFVKLYRIPPGKWLTKKRLEHGKYLLETTGKDINEIAFGSGFENTSHFIRIFKEKFGFSPRKYKSTILLPSQT